MSSVYRRAGNGIGLFRTGLGGAKMVPMGGIIALPLLHRITPFSMRTVMIAVERNGARTPETRDGDRIEIAAHFHIRLGRDPQALALASRLFDIRALNVPVLARLLDGPLGDALEGALAAQTAAEFRADRAAFVAAAQRHAADRLACFGLTLQWFELTLPGRFSAATPPAPSRAQIAEAARSQMETLLPGEAACQKVVRDAAAILSSNQISLVTKVALLRLMPEIVEDAAHPATIDTIDMVQIEKGADPVAAEPKLILENPIQPADKTAPTVRGPSLPSSPPVMAWQRPLRWRRF